MSSPNQSETKFQNLYFHAVHNMYVLLIGKAKFKLFICMKKFFKRHMMVFEKHYPQNLNVFSISNLICRYQSFLKMSYFCFERHDIVKDKEVIFFDSIILSFRVRENFVAAARSDQFAPLRDCYE
jgi:hypothetical protein